MSINGIGSIGSTGIDEYVVSKGAEIRAEQSTGAVQKSERVNGNNNKENESVNNEKVTPEKLDEALQNLNSSSEIIQSGLRFEKFEDSGEWVVKVVKIDNGEIIRQFPSEETLKIVKGIKEMLGAIFDKMV